jgi:hypothetical protein
MLFNSYDYFPDEDFCLYAKFPFQQLIFMFFFSIPTKTDHCSCTYLWMTKYNLILYKLCIDQTGADPYEMIGKRLEKKVKECNFEKSKNSTDYVLKFFKSNFFLL